MMLLVTSIFFFALSSHPVLNKKGQIWKHDSYKVYLLRTEKKKILFCQMDINSNHNKHTVN